MNKLLSANFARLWKSKFFRLGVVFLMALAVFVVLSEVRSGTPLNSAGSYDTLTFGYSQIIGFCCAVFASLFLGTEYSDGTIRNKLIVGHSRAGVYLANLVTVFSAMLLLIAAWLAGALSGIPFFGLWKNPAGCLVNFIASIFTTAAFSAIFTFIAMLCTNKAASAVVSILSFMGLSVIAGNVNYDFIRDFLPTGQAVWNAGASAESTVPALLCPVAVTLLGSVVIVAAASCTGLLLFQKKDLK